MRRWLIVIAVMAALPAWGDSHFRIRPMLRGDVPAGKGQCDIRLQVDNEIEVTVRGDTVTIRTIAGQDARDDGSECNFPLPNRDVPGFNFEVKDSRNEIRLVEPPNRRNRYAAIVHIRDTSGGLGRYHFRLSWMTGPDRAGPPGFAWNNVVNFHGAGRGEAVLNGQDRQQFRDVNVDIDHGGKVVVRFRGNRGTDDVVYTGAIVSRDGDRLRADMVTSDGRLRGAMVISVDNRNQANSITMDATDGRDHLHLTWDRR